MAGHRIDRVEEDMKRELSDIIRSVKDPRVTGLLSIVRVDVSGDLSYAKAYVSAMEGKEAALQAAKGLKSAEGYIKKELAHRIKLRKMPAFTFVADDSIAHSADITRILKDLEEDPKA